MKEKKSAKNSFKLSSCQEKATSFREENLGSQAKEAKNQNSEATRHGKLLTVTLSHDKIRTQKSMSKDLLMKGASKKERRSQKNLCISAKHLKRRGERRSLNFR